MKNYLKKLNNKIRTKAEEEETEYISKEEIMAGNDAGLKDISAESKQSATEFLKEVLASFKKEAKRLRKQYASFIDDYENKVERESISLKEIEELLRKNGLK